MKRSLCLIRVTHPLLPPRTSADRRRKSELFSQESLRVGPLILLSKLLSFCSPVLETMSTLITASTTISPRVWHGVLRNSKGPGHARYRSRDETIYGAGSNPLESFVTPARAIAFYHESNAQSATWLFSPAHNNLTVENVREGKSSAAKTRPTYNAAPHILIKRLWACLGARPRRTTRPFS